MSGAGPALPAPSREGGKNAGEEAGFSPSLTGGSIGDKSRVDKAAMKYECSYLELREIVQDRLSADSVAEAHGTLAGMLCADSNMVCEEWLENVSGWDGSGGPARDNALLAQLFEETQRRLEDLNFSFEPLLPEDSSPLPERAAALGEFCHGFLAGLGYSNSKSEWPGECEEILQDFVEISRLSPEGKDESDEEAYTELFEYVRIGVQVVRSELQDSKPSRRYLN
jgi:uncharacterized protein YgfB (UPF0149 family)